MEDLLYLKFFLISKAHELLTATISVFVDA